MPKTLRVRLVLTALGVLVAAAGIRAFAAYLEHQRATSLAIEQRDEETLPLLAGALAMPVAGGDRAEIERLVRPVVERSGVLRVWVLDATGREIADVSKAAAWGEARVRVILTEPVQREGRPVGTVRMAVSPVPASGSMQRTIAREVLIELFENLLLILVFVLVALVLTRNLGGLRAVAESVAAGNLSMRARVAGDDEVAQTARAFNQMLDGLQAAQALAARTDMQFRQLVEGSLQGVVILDGQWRVIFSNQALADIYGYADPAELAALPSAALLVAEADRDRLGEYNVARLAGEARPTRYEHRGTRKDGREIWLDTYVRVVDWEGVPAVQATQIDITDQKAAEKELRRSEARFRHLVEQSELATMVFDTEWRPVLVNEAAAQLYGYASADDALRNVASGGELLWEEDRVRVDGYRRARFEGRSAPTRYEARGVRRDGRLLSLQLIPAMVEWEGRPAIMVVSVDMTEHKQREEQLRQALKMEAVGQLTGGVAHDFNNLLTVILGNLELLRRRVGGEPKLAALLASVTAAAERGATLVQRLLAFSRKQALQPAAVDVNRLVAGMIDLLRRSLGEAIDVETVLSGGLWPALVDPNQLESTLLNLAINARDAMPPGGKLTIETGNARLDDDYVVQYPEVRSGQYVLLAVSDTGTGMTPEVLEHAFEPFFTTKEVGQGSGLGLSMIYGFVRQSGGHVKIYSELGHGTTVKVYLPRAQTPSGARGAPDTALVEPRGALQEILVVEDDEAVRSLAAAILTNLGYRPVVAGDGYSALRLLDAHPHVALLFTDVVLAGGMSGVELVHEARLRRPGLKVLYMSGYTANAIIHHGRLDDGVDLLEKPFRIDSLAGKVRAVLERD